MNERARDALELSGDAPLVLSNLVGGRSDEHRVWEQASLTYAFSHGALNSSTKLLIAVLLFATGFGSRRFSGAGTARSIVARVLFGAFGGGLIELKVLIKLLPKLWA